MAPMTLSTTTLIITLLHFLSPSSSFLQDTTPLRQGLVMEEKIRLGSTPPSCHNKCNLCHPCMAVQVPTLPSHNRVMPGHHRVMPMPADYYDLPPSSGGNQYSNYKPLGWKCRCDGHLYNP